MTTDCRRCGHRIRLLQRVDTGRRIAIDPDPDPLGTVTVTPGLGGPMADVGRFPVPDGTGYLPHYRTCAPSGERPTRRTRRRR